MFEGRIYMIMIKFLMWFQMWCHYVEMEEAIHKIIKQERTTLFDRHIHLLKSQICVTLKWDLLK